MNIDRARDALLWYSLINPLHVLSAETIDGLSRDIIVPQ